MVTTFILTAVLGVVGALLNLLPSWNVDASSITGFTGSIGEWLAKGNGYVPETLLFVCLGVLLAVKLGLLAWRGILFAYSLIPFN